MATSFLQGWRAAAGRDLFMTHIHSFLGCFLRNSGYTEADTVAVAAPVAYLMFVTIPLMQAL